MIPLGHHLIGISAIFFSVMIKLYSCWLTKRLFFSSLYSANDPIWLTKGVPYHLLHVLAKLLEKFGDSPSAVSTSER